MTGRTLAQHCYAYRERVAQPTSAPPGWVTTDRVGRRTSRLRWLVGALPLIQKTVAERVGLFAVSHPSACYDLTH